MSPMVQTGRTLGPVVIWIAIHPNTTTAENAHNTSPDILAVLKTNEVEGVVVVEWYEGGIERLSGPLLMRVTSNKNPTHYIHCVFTAVLGMPISTVEREDDDAQGSVTLFFHKNNDKHGNPSTKVLSVSTFSAGTPPSCTSSRALVHLASTFDLPDCVDSSVPSMRSRP